MDTSHVTVPTGASRVCGETRVQGPPLIIPLVSLALVTMLIRAFDLDVRIEQMFWGDNGWYLKGNRYVMLAYRYGPWPAVLFGALSAVLIGASFFIGRLGAVRRVASLILLTLLLGPGLVINWGLKSHFGRPRPREVKEFGGSRAFLPVGTPDFDGTGRSFPSGHASAGFFWLTGFIHYWSSRRYLAVTFGIAACVHGGLLGVTRMVQGAHWPSDVLWAAGVVYLICWGLHWVQTAALKKGAT